MAHKCPDCDEELRKISLLDQISGAKVNVGIEYTLDEAPVNSMWSGRITNAAGVVHGWLCPRCSRVLLYATTE